MAGTNRRRRTKASLHPRHMTPDKDFTPLPLNEGDELFPNGIFEFNITKMLAYIEADSGGFPAGETEVAPLRRITPERLDEKTIRHADVSKPILLAEISPGSFNMIDGNHRIERAAREGLKTIAARRIAAERHIVFLTSLRSYLAYIEYWNSKLTDT